MNEIEEFANECASCEIHYSDEADDKLTHYASEEEKQALTKQNRWHSPVVWGAIFGLVVTIFTATGLADKLGLDDDALKLVLMSIGGVLSAFGIINNPTDREGF